MEYAEIPKRTWNAVKNYCNSLIRGGQRWIFRGQADSQWRLESHMERLLGVDGTNRFVELDLMNQFRRRLNQYLPSQRIPESTAEVLALIQHYGGPTRLLDWTFSYYIAAYFMWEDRTPHPHRALWAINYDWLRPQTLDLLRPHFTSPLEIVAKDAKHILDEDVFSELLFASYKAIVPIEPFKVNDRIMVQNGLFLMNTSTDASFEENFGDYDKADCRRNIRKITLPNSKREEILNELQLMNITPSYLFPGVDGLSKSLSYQAEHTSRQLRGKP